MPKTNSEKLNIVGYDQSETVTDWYAIDWKQVERKVFKLQERIYNSAKNGDIAQVRKLQRTLTKSWSAKLLAVRMVTQENRGKKTAGVDGVKALNPKQRIDMAKNIKFSEKSKPAKRIWRPKANGEKRPLGIPTIMEDRAKQALLKLALEPEWETRFEPHSYGFRPARSSHDAIKTIYNAIGSSRGKWILDADIAGCFDNIDHDYLIKKLNTSPKFSKQIKAWLKAGAIEFSREKEYTPTATGTPQGGVISPLLANIALHGLEFHLKDWLYNVRKYRVKHWNKTEGRWCNANKKETMARLTVVRYADDFVIIHEDKEIIEEATEEIKKFLAQIGLNLKEAKTELVHSKEGFDFLGCNIKQWETGEYRSDKTKGLNSQRTGLVTLIQPSKESVDKHYQKVKEIIDKNRAVDQRTLISKLNPVIRGWCNYYKPYTTMYVYPRLQHLLNVKLRVWCRRRHTNKPKKWIYNKYFHLDNQIGERKWDFRANYNGGKNFSRLYTYYDASTQRHSQVKGEKSIYDGDYSYWSKRLKSHLLFTPKELTVLKEQKGRCNICQAPIKHGDRLEVDHINPKGKGGKNNRNNLQLIHQHCHINKTRKEAKSKTTESKTGWELGAV